MADYSFMNNLCVFGTVVKGSGSFSISHPDPSKTNTHKLIHSFVESPTAGDNIYRYEVEVIDGVAEIQLPDYYKYLNENTQVWITPKDGFGIAYGTINEDMTKVIIKANLDMIYNVLVIGTRKDKVAKDYWKGVLQSSKTPARKIRGNNGSIASIVRTTFKRKSKGFVSMTANSQDTIRKAFINEGWKASIRSTNKQNVFDVKRVA